MQETAVAQPAPEVDPSVVESEGAETAAVEAPPELAFTDAPSATRWVRGLPLSSVSQAYQELEREGVIYVRRGLGTFVNPDIHPDRHERPSSAGPAVPTRGGGIPEEARHEARPPVGWRPSATSGPRRGWGRARPRR